jgi:hypothetical protein
MFYGRVGILRTKYNLQRYQKYSAEDGVQVYISSLEFVFIYGKSIMRYIDTLYLYRYQIYFYDTMYLSISDDFLSS